MEWIMSEGGPLLCIEKALEHTWGGVDELTVPNGAATCDYDRACATNDWLILLPLAKSTAFAVGEGPMFSFFWRSKSDVVFIVQAFYGESDDKDDEKLAQLDDSIFDEPAHSADWEALSSPIALFDSAWPGTDEPGRKVIYFDIQPGRYRIQTQRFDPDPENAYLLHRFDPIV